MVALKDSPGLSGGGAREGTGYCPNREKLASIMGSATLCSSRWTQRCGRQLHRVQNRGKHRARLLPEKALCGCRPIRPSEEKVMNRSETRPLARQVEASQLMVAQGPIAVAPFHIGTGALEHRRQPFGRLLELVLGLLPQR